MIGWFWGLVAATVAAPLQAAIITEQYNFTLPADSGIYSAGLTFQVTATYDTAAQYRPSRLFLSV